MYLISTRHPTERNAETRRAFELHFLRSIVVHRCKCHQCLIWTWHYEYSHVATWTTFRGFFNREPFLYKQLLHVRMCKSFWQICHMQCACRWSKIFLQLSSIRLASKSMISTVEEILLKFIIIRDAFLK